MLCVLAWCHRFKRFVCVCVCACILQTRRRRRGCRAGARRNWLRGGRGTRSRPPNSGHPCTGSGSGRRRYTHIHTHTVAHASTHTHSCICTVLSSVVSRCVVVGSGVSLMCGVCDCVVAPCRHHNHAMGVVEFAFVLHVYVCVFIRIPCRCVRTVLPRWRH